MSHKWVWHMYALVYPAGARGPGAAGMLILGTATPRAKSPGPGAEGWAMGPGTLGSEKLALLVVGLTGPFWGLTSLRSQRFQLRRRPLGVQVVTPDSAHMLWDPD